MFASDKSIDKLFGEGSSKNRVELDERTESGNLAAEVTSRNRSSEVDSICAIEDVVLIAIIRPRRGSLIALTMEDLTRIMREYELTTCFIEPRTIHQGVYPLVG